MTETPPPPRLTIPPGVTWELPPAHEDQEPLAGRFGATYAPGGFQPVPVVTIGGDRISSGRLGEDPGTPWPDQVVVDGFSVTWGRDRVMDQPELASATVTLFDTTNTWHKDRQRIGKLVTIGYTGTIPGAGGGDVSSVFFRGRVQKVQAVRKTVRIDGAMVTGTLVTMPLVSVLNDLANITPTGAWPEESMEARRARLEALAIDVIPGGVSIRDAWKTPSAAPVAVDAQKSVWDHLLALYDSCGADRYAYYPSDQTLRFMPRRDYFNLRGLAGLWWNQATEDTLPGRAAQGVYARSFQVTPTGGTAGTPHYLDGQAVEADPGDGIEQGPEHRVSRISMTNPDGTTADFTSRTTVHMIPDVNERTEGTRQVAVDSVLTWNSWADLAADDVRQLARNEGREWRLPELTWDTKRSGGFETFEQAVFYLWGAETASNVFIQRTWLSGYGIRPIFGVMGGRIRYQRRRWIVGITLAPVVTTLPQHAITWEEIDDGSGGYEIQWWDTPRGNSLHESLTYEDLRYVSTGLGVTVIPPDTGWDETQ